ncbi:hypothetical protein [Polynucleobacter sp. MWH-UH25E]|uniref:hypothetical protein n=1 Tax=Polynucleobacter sp. MWH-UH25E TaxID=1855616 RepID=UPI001BFCE28B|nr:hypothetical protein [Polynucleobacter sp. MWH-UH25E]QWD61375.1 hypothetical protein ICV39_06215 [Polynucleobacter sp. MWH-UH25E]
MNSSHISLATAMDLPGYIVGGAMLLLVMVFHGAILLQIAKRYEVKTFIYLAEQKYSKVGICFYISVLYLFLTHIAEILLWGFALYSLKLLPALGQSILFGGSTYTAMGFMEDILPEGWKMLAVIIAFSGMFAFAWTASVMIAMTKNFRQAYTKLHMKKLNVSSEIIDRFE